MGICESCLKNEGKSGYKPIKEMEESRINSTITEEVSTQNFLENKDTVISNTINLDSFVFKGIEVQQKFTEKPNYENRFLWINRNCQLIHMSRYITKERKHKEANLTDITKMTCGPPQSTPTNIQEFENFYELCLTVSFKKGGGIDLMFESKAQRDEWYLTVKKLLDDQKNFKKEK